MPLHNLIRGGTTYPGANEAEMANLRATYKFVRGCLIRQTDDGGSIVPPPCLRAEIVSKVHEEVVHVGWERTYQALK